MASKLPYHQVRTFDTPIQVVLAGLVGIGLGGLVVFLEQSWLLLVIGAIIFVMITIRRPVWGILAVLLVLTTVIPESRIPLINVGPLRVLVSDLVVVFLFALIVLRMMLVPGVTWQRTALDLPLLGFLIVAVGTTVWSLMNGRVMFQFAIPEIRIIFYYLLFYITTNLVRSTRDIEFVIEGMNWLAGLVALLMVLQFAVGRTIPILEGRIEVLSEQAGSITRITDTPGEGLITVMVIINLIRLITGKVRMKGLVFIGLLALQMIALIMTFNRTHWLMVFAAVLLTLFVTEWKERDKFVYWGVVLVLFIIVIVGIALINPSSDFGHFVMTSLQRGLTMFQLDSYQQTTQSTLRWRDFEYQYGFMQVARHPVIGMGLGAIYRPNLFVIDHPNFFGQVYTHNAHLWLAMKTGLLGYGLFMLFILRFILRGFLGWKKIEDPSQHVLLLAITCVMLTVVIGANIHPFFMTLFWSPLIAVLLGLGEAIIRVGVKEGE